MTYRMSILSIAADTNPALAVLGVALAVAAFVLFVAALVSIWRSPRLTTSGKALWTLIVLVAQVVGSIVWFVWGRRTSGSDLYAG